MLEKFKNNKPRPHQISQNLLMVEKANGDYDVFIFKIHSETDLSVNNRRDFFYEVNYGKTPTDFSGELVITTINEELIRGWRVNDGKILMSFRAVKGNKRLNYANFSGTCGITESESCEVTTSMEYDSFLGEETMSSEINCFYTYQYECIDPEDNSQGPASEEPDPLEGTGGGGLEVNEDPPCNTFEDRVNHVLNTEGGFVNDPLDKGGATNRGISWDVWAENAQKILGKQPTLTNLENLSAEEAKLIYKSEFWDKIYLDQIIDGDLKWLIFDFYVNSGSHAIRILQRELNKMGHKLSVDGGMGPLTISAINSTSDIISLYNNYKIGRKTFVENLVQKSINKYLIKHPNAQEQELLEKTQLRFKTGWLNRINNFINKTIEKFTDVNC